jgi:hypothetical protein
VVGAAAPAALFYLVTALWFDVAYWCIGRFAADRVGRHARIMVSIALAFVAFGALAAAGPTRPAPSPSPQTAAVASTNASGAGDQRDTAGPEGSASPASSSVEITLGPAADPDDESSAASGAGASFAPDSTGLRLPPDAAADRLPGEPDRALTPGALNPDVTQATIGSTICVSGWTATIRPDSSYTDGLKITQMAAYAYADTSTAAYEEDHLIPLELGGAPADPRNLWPEPYAAALADGRSTGARVKDEFENELKRQVCAGAMALAVAQAEVGVHWVHAYYDIELPPAPTSTASPSQAFPPTPEPTPRPGGAASLKVTLVDVPNPAQIGGATSVTASTSAGAVCTVKITLPSGHDSTVKSLDAPRTAGDDGLVSWVWTVASNTKAGTAKARVTCALAGASASAQTTFPMVN